VKTRKKGERMKGPERGKKDLKGQKDQKGTIVKEGKEIIGIIEILNAETRIEDTTREIIVGEMIGRKKRTQISSKDEKLRG